VEFKLFTATYYQKLQAHLPGVRDYFYNAWVEIAITIIGFGGGVLMARWLGPFGRGQFSAATLWPAISAIVISLGLSHAFPYAIGAKWASPQQLARFGLKYTLFAGVPATVIYWFLCPWIFNKQFYGEMWIPRVFAVFIPLTLYVGLLHSFYQRSGDFFLWNVGRLFRSGSWTLSIVALAIVNRLTVANLLLVQLGITVVLGVFFYSQLKRLPREEGEWVPIRRILKYGLAVYISAIAYSVNQQLDQLLLTMWVTPAELGQYAAAVTLAGIILIVPGSIGPIVFSKVARASTQPLEQRRHIRIAFLLTVSILIPAGGVLTILAPLAARTIYGPAYSQAGDLLLILTPATIFLGMGFFLSDLLKGVGKPSYATYGAFSGAVITVAGLAWALPRFGIWGAAWVSFIAYSLMMCIQIILLWKWMINLTAAHLRNQLMTLNQSS
jgi:O-antigen/teichoic acid export membrane protein